MCDFCPHLRIKCQTQCTLKLLDVRSEHLSKLNKLGAAYHQKSAPFASDKEMLSP